MLFNILQHYWVKSQKSEAEELHTAQMVDINGIDDGINIMVSILGLGWIRGAQVTNCIRLSAVPLAIWYYVQEKVTQNESCVECDRPKYFPMTMVMYHLINYE